MDLAPGAKVRENLELVRPLGEGAMGSVWVAKHLGLRNEVAVKFIHSDDKDDPVLRRRFQREAASCAQIKSPHVVQIYDHGMMEDGTPFMVMEMLEGESLGDYLDRHTRLSHRMTCDVIAQVSRGLTKAHALGIIHRDIKPENIYLVQTDEGLTAKVLDFGVAKIKQEGASPNSGWAADGKLTQPGKLVGTPAYMSREQIVTARECDEHVDLWGLAVVAYECLTGVLPFDGETIGLICVAICQGDFRPPSALAPGLPKEVDAFFGRAFSKDVEARFASPKQLAFELLLTLSAQDTDADSFERALDRSGKFSLPPPSMVQAAASAASADASAPPSSRRMRDVAPVAHSLSNVTPPPQVLDGDPDVELMMLGRGGRWPKAAVGSVVVGAVLMLCLAAFIAISSGSAETVSPTHEAHREDAEVATKAAAAATATAATASAVAEGPGRPDRVPAIAAPPVGRVVPHPTATARPAKKSHKSAEEILGL